jgi:polyhydroxyalkanoate synthesis regulator phasin
MVLDGLRGYIQLASGLTDVTRERALAAAKSLLAQGEAGVGVVVPPPVRAQVGALTDDLLATSRTNRNLLVNLVRAEVERSVARLGLVSQQELAAATRRSQSLERRVEELEDDLHRSRSATKGTAKKTTKQSAAKKTTKQSAAKKPAKKSAAKRTAKKSAAKRTAKTTTATAATTSTAGETGATEGTAATPSSSA